MKKVKFRKSLVSNVIALFLFFNILSILLFTYYTKQMEQSNSLTYARKSLLEIVEEKSELISIRFERVESHVQVLGAFMEKVLAEDNVSDKLSKEYIHEADGTISREKNSLKSDLEQSNLFVPNTAHDMEEIIEEINATEELDALFSKILENEEIIWAYIATENELLRCSPYSDLQDSFTSSHRQSGDIFYTMANDVNNPQRKAVWTKPYTDYLGTGWTMTCSQPVYDREGNLYGVIGLDVLVEGIKEEYFGEFNLGETGKVIWLDEDGNLFYHTDYNEKAQTQGAIYEKNLFEMEGIEEEELNAIRRALREESGITTFRKEATTQIMAYASVGDMGSTLIVRMDMDEFQAVETFDFRSITVILMIDLLLAILFAIMLYYRFSKPMKLLVGHANRISKGDFSSIIETPETDSEYYEIAQLNHAFAVMNRSVESYTETLLDKNKEISTIISSVNETLMIADLDGEIKMQSKEAPGITDMELVAAVKRIEKEKVSFGEQVVKNGQIYKNVYYPIIKENGQIDKIVISSENITQNILLEKEVQQLEKMAGVGQLSAAIVHELKNALARIKGAAYILNFTGNEEEKDEVRTISRAVEDAENVITTLLDFSKRDSGGGEMVHIGTLIHQILLLSKKELIGKNIKTNLNLDNDCYIFSTGREALKVILQNIILNAIQAVSCDGVLTISCGNEGGSVIIKIRDNGGGIKIKPKERIFEPFLSTKVNGTGIGLWITKRLVDSMRGTIHITEDERIEPGEAEFVIIIPEKEEGQK